VREAERFARDRAAAEPGARDTDAGLSSDAADGFPGDDEASPLH